MLNLNVKFNSENYVINIFYKNDTSFYEILNKIKESVNINEEICNLKLFFIKNKDDEKNKEIEINLNEKNYKDYIKDKNNFELKISNNSEKIKKFIFDEDINNFIGGISKIKNSNDDEDDLNNDEDNIFNNNNNDEEYLNSNEIKNKEEIENIINKNDEENEKNETLNKNEQKIEENENKISENNENNNENEINNDINSLLDKVKFSQLETQNILFTNNSNNQINENSIIKNSNENKISKKESNCFELEKCSICSSNLNKIKYVCIICDDLILCDKCENFHNHPTFKYKNIFFSNIIDSYYLMKKFFFENLNDYNPKKLLDNLINSNEYDLKIETVFEDDISMQPNETIKIPILISNRTSNVVYSEDILLIIKNQKNINVKYNSNKKFILSSKNSIEVELIIKSNEKKSKEKINIEIFSQKFKIKKKSNVNNIFININIGFDEEEIELNKQFENCPKLINCSKEHKNMLKYVIENGLSTKGPLEVFYILKKNFWNIDKSIEDLTSE